ncbi:hypothetical protein AB1Y20_008944 [Prymnesium parvum]|uniref:Uncharacterized protein n=1 Tax=Prymnesium parvum TaxID=97485 RepID=A0AB34K000_PRYPA
MGWHGWQRIEISRASPLGACVHGLRWLLGLRASPRLLLIICAVQLLVLLASTLQMLHRSECIVSLPRDGPVLIDCASCREAGLDGRAALTSLAGAAVIGAGALAVHQRDAKLLYFYGSAMIFFSFVVGLTAVLTALETPVLEVALEQGVNDEVCLEMASRMMLGARDRAALASLGCLVYSLGAVLAIRSKELFTYEEISASHAAVSSAQSL